MRKRNIAIAVLLASAAAGSGQAASLFVFGDSLVDSGNAEAGIQANNLFRVSQGLPPEPSVTPVAGGYFQNRFSNGYNFADYLSNDLFGGYATYYGVKNTPFFGGGNNFSVGGAQAREQAGDRSPSFTEQIDTFVGSGKTIGADDLVLVTFGGNDIQSELRFRAAAQAQGIPYTPPSPDVIFADTLNAMTNGIDRLLGFGARNIVVTGQADVGAIPRVKLDPLLASFSGAGTSLSQYLNGEFAEFVTDYRATDAGRGVVFFDLYDFQTRLLANPDPSFSILDRTWQSGGVPAVATDCPGYLYFDPIHPVREAHRAIASGIEAQLAAVPEPATWATMMLGFGLVGLAARRRRRGVAA